jgi:nitrogen-specific signal transduction histidine kinase
LRWPARRTWIRWGFIAHRKNGATAELRDYKEAQLPRNGSRADLQLLGSLERVRGDRSDTKRHIFEPFFTTKAENGGSGIGLSTLYAIVHNADGSIVVESYPDQGTTFTVVLPAARD